MNSTLDPLAAIRAAELRQSVARHRLVFAQIGHPYAKIRQAVTDQVADHVLRCLDIIDGADVPTTGTTIVQNCDELLSPTSGHGVEMLGFLRERLTLILDQGGNVCLQSGAPRVAFGRGPGSSLLDDAAYFRCRPLTGDELIRLELAADSVWPVPAMCEPDFDLVAMLAKTLEQLGTDVLSALDHALFETHPRSADGLAFLAPRIEEALRGAGVLVVQEQQVSLVHNHLLSPVKSVLADVLSKHNAVPRDLASVSAGLWFIERTIRSALRVAAVRGAGDKWRGDVCGGGLAEEILRRARGDSCPGAASIKELRDPIEWLTLGELLSLVTSEKFGGLGVEAVVWRRFADDLVPVRNRLSHMRLLKQNDLETVSMWATVIRQQLAESK